ncbi:MAG: uroporphyrinogen decarboxylase [Dissulfurimicrobium sp.]|uniref:uroporphyrinogen decarboxylase n=1 Tax=Dissulfurimicrobium TaxID=1769732 RepID=UPI001ED9DBDC|nr:uroporphyrinogen decarboxylase [Dissulfurimicrobium hydrothermale]UKL12981.1 uroporphyrinogen decarboxylase [Dissulfurimicrobium hydrothermale]
MKDIFLKACKGEKTRPIPVWVMRQAGRYLPDYQRVRGGMDFLTLCKTPRLAADVTLQPVDILGMDAAILFSDILIPAEAMGINLVFSEGKGPILSPPVRTERDISALRNIDPAADTPFVLETIAILRDELKDKVPLIGFAGAPFTLATYMIEGGSSKNFLHTKKMMFSAPELFHRLMALLTDVTMAYLLGQIGAGAQAVQVFDTWAGVLSRTDYKAFVLPYVKQIFTGIKKAGVPGIYFVLDGCHLLEETADAGADVIGLDWRTEIKDAVFRLGDVSIQGNLDPCSLFLPENFLREKVRSILEQGTLAKSHIFNLGHGVLPEIPYEKVRLLVELVHELSA